MTLTDTDFGTLTVRVDDGDNVADTDDDLQTVVESDGGDGDDVDATVGDFAGDTDGVDVPVPFMLGVDVKELESDIEGDAISDAE